VPATMAAGASARGSSTSRFRRNQQLKGCLHLLNIPGTALMPSTTLQRMTLLRLTAARIYSREIAGNDNWVSAVLANVECFISYLSTVEGGP